MTRDLIVQRARKRLSTEDEELPMRFCSLVEDCSDFLHPSALERI